MVPTAIERIQNGQFLTPAEGFIALTFAGLVGTSLSLAIEELAKVHDGLGEGRTPKELNLRRQELVTNFLDEQLLPLYRVRPYPEVAEVQALVDAYEDTFPLVQSTLVSETWMRAAERRIQNMETRDLSPHFSDDAALERVLRGLRPTVSILDVQSL
jgi:hypothetical protein